MKFIKRFDDPRDEELVTVYTDMDEDDPNKKVEFKIKFYDLPYQQYEKVSDKLMKLYPEFRIHQRGKGQFFDFDFHFDSKTEIWVGCYDIIAKNFYLFSPEEGNGSIGHYDQGKVKPAICIEDTELEEGFERFVGLWFDIKDDLSTDKRWPDIQARDGKQQIGRF